MLIGQGSGREAGKYLFYPSWAAPGVDFYVDFRKPGNVFDDWARYTAAEKVDDTHATDILALSSTGYETIAPDVLPRTDLGLLTTVGRTNLFTYSNDLTQSAWSKEQVTAGAPTDGWTPVREATDSGFHRLSRSGAGSATVSIGATYIDVFTVRKVGRRYLGIRNTTGAGEPFSSCGFDLDANGGDGEVTYQASGRTASIKRIGADTYALAVAWTATQTTVTTNGIFIAESEITANILPSFVGDDTKGFDLFNADLQEGPFATDPIITEGSAVTRPGNMPVIDLTGRLGEGVAGVIAVDVLQPLPTSGSVVVLCFSDGSTGNVIELQMISAGWRFAVTTEGGSQAYLNIGSPPSGPAKIAFAVASNYAAARIVGLSGATDASVVFPQTSQLAMGGRGFVAHLNTYQRTERLALKFGPQDQASFDTMYALAQEWAAQ